ncbi:MAG: hypothetical protein IPH12_22505 [Saprospirales bacterium]|jgi:hypothetical protein|nr:hypothetical protein [Saprospirales bacterium]MBK8922462.1 hypothetical protein [Saprospirales bacterium]
MMRIIGGILLLTVIFGQVQAQSTAFVFQGGLSIGFQKWDNSFDRQPLYKYHAALSIESVNNDNDNASIFAQLGYHVRGSATRFRFFFQGGGIDQFSEEFQFHNISLILGGKQKFPLGERSRYFYYGGVRGDYTLSTNIDALGLSNPYAPLYYPQVGFMNRWIAGVSLGGGIELPFSDLIGGQLMLSVHPDFLYQYNQPAIPNVIDPFNPGQNTTIQERRIRNVTIELSLGLRLLRKVVYEN